MYEPQPEHRFTFGLWTVGSIGRDPFKAYAFDRVALGQRGMKYERLDQLVNEFLRGVH